jgi:hypothetical protein
MYVNGLPVLNNTAATAYSAPSYFMFGGGGVNNNCGGGSYNGYLDDIRIYNRSLSDTEIYMIYNNTAP